MEDILLRSASLEQARGLFTDNTSIHEAISAALSETEAYAADELVELAEEVLHQIAAVGVVHYLQHAPQKEVYNDFLVQLFNSSGHDYNAGPLFRWAANMVKECPAMQSSARYPFFWQKAEGGLRLAERVHHLAELRNQVMHGFFVLPPEKNRVVQPVLGGAFGGKSEPFDLEFALVNGQLRQMMLEFVGRDIGEEFVNMLDADFGEHIGAISIGKWKIAHRRFLWA
jgi:hypothetical protein